MAHIEWLWFPVAACRWRKACDGTLEKGAYPMRKSDEEIRERLSQPLPPNRQVELSGLNDLPAAPLSFGEASHEVYEIVSQQLRKLRSKMHKGASTTATLT